jgi:hypothetical protein
MTAGAAVVRIGVRIDALLVTTRRLAPEATAVVFALFTERFRRYITVRTAVGFGSRVARTADCTDEATTLQAVREELIDRSLAISLTACARRLSDNRLD